MQQPVQRTLQLSPFFDEQCEHFESVQPAPHQLQMVQDHPQLMLQMVQQMLQPTTHTQQTSLLKIAFHASNLRRTMLRCGATVQHRSPCVSKPHTTTFCTIILHVATCRNPHHGQIVIAEFCTHCVCIHTKCADACIVHICICHKWLHCGVQFADSGCICI